MTSRRRPATDAFETPSGGPTSQRRRLVTRSRSGSAQQDSGVQQQRATTRSTNVARSTQASRRRRPSQPAVSSIRAGARIASVSTGSQTGRRYRREESAGEGGMADEEPGPREEAGVRLMQRFDAQEEHKEDELPPPQEARFCYCDMPVLADCTACSENQFCVEHPYLRCSGDCGRWFHVNCAGWNLVLGPYGGEEGAYVVSSWDHELQIPLSEVSQGDEHPWFCIKCWEAHKRDHQVTSDASFDALSLPDKAQRLGMNLDASQTLSTHRRQVDKRLDELGGFLVEEPALLETIKGSAPRPFPTSRPMNQASREEQSSCGRQFELSMLCFQIQQCNCCGIIKPQHTDSQFPSSYEPFRRAHLSTKFHPAWFCACDRPPCKGGQFYAARKPTETDFFQRVHDDQLPGDFLDLDTPNAQLCDSCYKEINKVEDLNFARRLSARNGYGPIPPPPPSLPMAVELDHLLNTATLVEEAAVRQIAPLMAIVRLRHGNIGTKGTTSCVWQESKLHLLLPNLPWECRFIVLQWMREGNPELGSCSFKRIVIERLLYLLPLTGLEPWREITVDPARIAAWPEEGNLLFADGVTRVSAPESDATVLDPVEEQERPDNEDRHQDGDDLGPAPLQAALAEEEVFEGVVGVSSDSGSNLVGAEAAETALSQLAAELLGANAAAPAGAAPAAAPATNPGSATSPGAGQIPVQLDGDTARVQQQAVLPTGGFVRMRQTRYAFHRAFPTVFRPSFVDGRWVILGDPTCYINTRDKSVSYPAWHQWLMWRSDGLPARHPTFALFAYKENFRHQLQGQGRVALSLGSGQIDTSITAEEFLALWQAGEPGQRSLRSKLQYFAGNVRGSDQYWQSTKNAFLATSFYHSYVEETVTNFYHTVSIAEWHDPHLRRLLAKYAKEVERDPAVAAGILDNDAAFHKAIHRYKHVLTHYLACKMEVWVITFLQSGLGLLAKITFGD